MTLSLATIVEEHNELLAALEGVDLRKLGESWTHHINSQNCDVDYQKIIEARREQLRASRKAQSGM